MPKKKLPTPETAQLRQEAMEAFIRAEEWEGAGNYSAAFDEIQRAVAAMAKLGLRKNADGKVDRSLIEKSPWSDAEQRVFDAILQEPSLGDLSHDRLPNELRDRVQRFLGALLIAVATKRARSDTGHDGAVKGDNARRNSALVEALSGTLLPTKPGDRKAAAMKYLQDHCPECWNFYARDIQAKAAWFREVMRKSQARRAERLGLSPS